jgi:hypothetical protein
MRQSPHELIVYRIHQDASDFERRADLVRRFPFWARRLGGIVDPRAIHVDRNAAAVRPIANVLDHLQRIYISTGHIVRALNLDRAGRRSMRTAGLQDPRNDIPDENAVLCFSWPDLTSVLGRLIPG